MERGPGKAEQSLEASSQYDTGENKQKHQVKMANEGTVPDPVSTMMRQMSRTQSPFCSPFPSIGAQFPSIHFHFPATLGKGSKFMWWRES